MSEKMPRTIWCGKPYHGNIDGAIHYPGAKAGYTQYFRADIAESLAAALAALKLECLADPLNPCWNARPTDKPGLHWGSETDAPIPACSSCNARAALAKTKGAP